MMKKHTRTALTALTALLAALTTGLAVAQDYNPLQPRSVGEITVINAGASAEEVDELKRLSPQYPLRLVMSNPNGEYVVARTLLVKKEGRTLAQLDDAGPWLLMDLAPGRYTFEGDFEGQRFTKAVTVGRQGNTTHWVMPRAIE